MLSKKHPLTRPLRGGTSVTVETEPLSPALVDELWELYVEAFTPMQEKALLCHLYPESEFRALVTSPEVVNIVGWSGERPVALLTLTNALEIVPQISPKFLYARYPEHAARNAIFFGVIVLVSPRREGGPALFSRLIAEGLQYAAHHDAVGVIDVADVNLRVAKAIAGIAEQFPLATCEHLDAQTYFAFTLPEPVSDEDLGAA